MRVGIGYDIHRTVTGGSVRLGGVEIPSSLALEGHSDADVVLHALMDALLGAAALGDIGKHFPPGDERFRGISSLNLLAQVREMVEGCGYRIVNVDVVVVAERPRVGPHVPAMQEKIGGVLRIEHDAVGIKATTNESVGPEGRGEAISARAVALLEETP